MRARAEREKTEAAKAETRRVKEAEKARLRAEAQAAKAARVAELKVQKQQEEDARRAAKAERQARKKAEKEEAAAAKAARVAKRKAAKEAADAAKAAKAAAAASGPPAPPVAPASKEPEVEAGPAENSAGIAAARTFREKAQPEIRKIYEDLLKRDPSVTISIYADVTIRPDGTVSEVEFENRNPTDPDFRTSRPILSNQFEMAIKKTQFDKMKREMTFSFPILLVPKL